MSKWTQGLEFDLCAAVGEVLNKHGLHPQGADEHEGWTPEQASRFAQFMRAQVDDIEVQYAKG